MLKNDVPCCPYCGGKFRIAVCDDEGNVKSNPQEYRKNPWSGLCFAIQHEESDVPSGAKCPIASHDGDNSIQGIWLYDTEEKAIEALRVRGNEEASHENIQGDHCGNAHI